MRLSSIINESYRAYGSMRLSGSLTSATARFSTTDFSLGFKLQASFVSAEIDQVQHAYLNDQERGAGALPQRLPTQRRRQAARRQLRRASIHAKSCQALPRPTPSSLSHNLAHTLRLTPITIRGETNEKGDRNGYINSTGCVLYYYISF